MGPVYGVSEYRAMGFEHLNQKHFLPALQAVYCRLGPGYHILRKPQIRIPRLFFFDQSERSDSNLRYANSNPLFQQKLSQTFV